jgi:hypothetical protein
MQNFAYFLPLVCRFTPPCVAWPNPTQKSAHGSLTTKASPRKSHIDRRRESLHSLRISNCARRHMYPDADEPGSQDEDLNTHFSEERAGRLIVSVSQPIDK